MMAARAHDPRLIDRLPRIRGRYVDNAPVARLTRFGVGGPAEVMFSPADADDLAAFLAARPADVPLTVIGAGSNLLVRDGGVPGVVARLDRGFAEVVTAGPEVRAGAAALDTRVAAAARDAGIAGLEFLCGVPGTIGGALRMNAGATGIEMKDVVLGARAIAADGIIHDLDNRGLGFEYRRSGVPEDWIFVSAVLGGRAGERTRIARRMEEIRRERLKSQPFGARTAGSTFANPPGGKAWELVERAGCRGLAVGGAVVSEKHCNFLINTGAATAADLERLGEEVRRRVLDATGVELEWEVRRIGVAAGPAIGEVMT